jgi:hypothetical protein
MDNKRQDRPKKPAGQAFGVTVKPGNLGGKNELLDIPIRP